MSPPSKIMPKIWVVRHGETEWSLSGQHVRGSHSRRSPASFLTVCLPFLTLFFLFLPFSRLFSLRPPSSFPQTGQTDLPLTQRGEDVIRALGKRIVGAGQILDPAHIQHAFVSPRSRARKTFELLFESAPNGEPKNSVEEGVREWDYGVCEGASFSVFLLLFKRGLTREEGKQAKLLPTFGRRLESRGTSGRTAAPRESRRRK
jgi:broad specificity phosphatase PhoE